MRPNFFIVGKPKCGTTALHYMLGQHPDIFMSAEKEPHHFASDKAEAAERRRRGFRGLPYKDRQRYLELFSEAEAESIVGESSTGYLYSKCAAEEIAAFNPDARILMVFREPVSYMHSMHGQLLRSANEVEPDFGKALALEETRKRGELIPSTTSYPNYLFYTEQAQYAEQAERFLTAFDAEQVKIVVYEDFKRDNLAVYREVLEFLGVDPLFTPDPVKLQAYKRVRFPRLASWLTYYGEKRRGSFAECAPDWLQQLVRPVFSHVFFTNDPRPPLDPDLRRELAARFRPDVLRLAELTGIDVVAKWGYEEV